MTIDTAKKAAKMLKQIEKLDCFKNTLINADRLTGNIHVGNNGVGFSWAKGTEEARYIQYIVDGIEIEIARIKDELRRM